MYDDTRAIRAAWARVYGSTFDDDSQACIHFAAGYYAALRDNGAGVTA